MILVLGVTMKLGVREIDISPLLNCHPTKLSVRSVCEFCMMVQIKEISEQFNYGFFLKIGLTKHLEITNVGHRVWSNILRVELEAGKNIMEEL